MQKVSLGRIVFVVGDDGNDYPAIVTLVHTNGAINATAFDPRGHTLAFASVPYCEAPPEGEQERATWHWPPRV